MYGFPIFEERGRCELGAVAGPGSSNYNIPLIRNQDRFLGLQPFHMGIELVRESSH